MNFTLKCFIVVSLFPVLVIYKNIDTVLYINQIFTFKDERLSEKTEKRVDYVSLINQGE